MDELFQAARRALTHVYWLGGPGCSGKSSVARILGRELDLRVYDVDAERQHHELDPSLMPAKWRAIDFSGKQGQPLMCLPSSDVASYVIDAWKAIFVPTIRHLLTLPRDKGIIVEGVFLPETLLLVTDRGELPFWYRTARSVRQTLIIVTTGSPHTTTKHLRFALRWKRSTILINTGRAKATLSRCLFIEFCRYRTFTMWPHNSLTSLWLESS